MQYNFFGTLYETLRIDDATFAPDFNYSYIHHVESVTQEFLDFLSEPMTFHLYIAPYIDVKEGEQPSTTDPVVVSRITGRTLEVPPIEKMDEKTLRRHALQMERDLRGAREKIGTLTQLLQDASQEVERLRGGSHKGGNLAGALAADAAVNNNS